MIALEKNPTYRDDFYDAEPRRTTRVRSRSGRMKGRKLPLVDRVEVYIIEESQPRWLSFLNAQHECLRRSRRVRADRNSQRRLAPNLDKRGVQMDRIPLVDIVVTYFNLEHRWSAATHRRKSALRRALSLSYDRGRKSG